MKKLFLVTLLVLVITLGFAKVKVTFWHAMGGGHGKTLQEIVDFFNQQHPDIEVEAVYIGNYSTLQQKLLAAAQAGGLPTISQAYSNWTAKLIYSGIVQPLNDFLTDPKIGLSSTEWQDIWEPMRMNCTWDKTVYAVPFNKSIYVMYVNTDALTLAGLNIPETIGELKKAAILMTEDFDGDGTIDQYGFAFRSTVDHFEVFLALNGGDILAKDENGKWKVTINSSESREVLQFLLDLKDKYAFVQGGYLDGPFGEGKIAMFIETVASKPYVASASQGKHGWSWAPLPVWKTQNALFAGTDLIMFSTAKDEEKKAAWEFMKFLISPDITAYWATKTGYLPVRKSATETDLWKKFLAENPDAEVPLKQLPNGVFDPQLGVWAEIRTIVGNMVNDVLYGKKTIDEGLSWAEQEIARELQREGL
ncbi:MULTISPECIES: ABC transporter substrate-binding protein [Pseudothermotoga]|jgi:multiple sugar transport system substrate-binding protein|uniref:Extracellular solute-binding protein family 1 n=1 Tax=Pseudothermotoga lettingae (strain ATCC BAA-301 / DSM 14385 / NBRC 107922 / TMO) TaxID=416591 RepID=A8F7T3_PSELT|nr:MULTISPECIES: ABC transporter substrate-binding protein [Pseudothermotoga]ABV34217.1 extracellular solute-binding protein family 1 [Pseudothermotoga lettingae TMO]KUK20080.1 MAG: Extracellular solute-binding protein family 1 [Pseudothermotoga lettingae]MDI3494488.1 multiple sugar transport system substrate-binding protein [Pseudothermotoga sp.]MDK2884822.1 multiple sugar transport system substrate-binding protein [Pseudothermotoga sp.]GLI48839.1 ABC transporter substrate-binding protein [Ps